MNKMVLENLDQIEKTILNTSTAVADKSSKEVIHRYDKQIKSSIRKLANIYFLLNGLINTKKSKDLSDIEFDSQMLLWQGANSFIGALQLIKQGYFLEPQVIFRNIVENLALTLDLKNNPSKYSLFEQGKLSGEKSITAAKIVMPQIGMIYGLLSEIAHPSKKFMGHYVYLERKTMLIGGGVVEEYLHRVKLNLSVLDFLLIVYWSAIEFIYLKYVEDTNFWKFIDANTLRLDPKPEIIRENDESLLFFEETIKEFTKWVDKIRDEK